MTLRFMTLRFMALRCLAALRSWLPAAPAPQTAGTLLPLGTWR